MIATASDLLIDAARIALAEVEECLFWIGEHKRTLKDGTERPEFLHKVERQMDYRYRRYLDYLRRYSEARADLETRGVALVWDY